MVLVSEPENLVGTVIDDRFEILDQLGQGGMGAVYRARQRSIGRDVALKVIDRAMEADIVAVKRFLREAQVASELVHPNTVGVVDFGQSKTGRLYLAMELVRGRNLKDVLNGAALDLRRVVRIGVQLCDALEAAHALGIIHRDLKLENVMLLDGPNDRDHVKILDFGLARRVVEQSRATATGLIAGTPRYLPPEVAYHNAEPAPPQDMYALGVVLGELATGRSLWEGPTLEALFAAKLTTTPKLHGVPSGLKALIMWLLDNDPSQRPDAAAARNALLALDGKVVRAAPDTNAVRTSVFRPMNSDSQLPTADWPAADVGPPAVDVLPAVDAPLAVDTTPGVFHSHRVDSSAVAPSQPSASLPESAFEPPRVPDDALEVDRDWQHEKAAKIENARHPPARRSAKLWGVAAAIAIVAIVGSVVAVMATTPGKARQPKQHAVELPATANTVSIEVKSRPGSSITIDGRKAGPAPLTLHLPKSQRSLQLGAEFKGQVLIRTVVPDRDQAVDFGFL